MEAEAEGVGVPETATRVEAEVAEALATVTATRAEKEAGWRFVRMAPAESRRFGIRNRLHSTRFLGLEVAAEAPEAEEVPVLAPEPVAAAVVVVVGRSILSLGSGATAGAPKPREMVTARGKAKPKEMATGLARAVHR